MSWSAHQFEAYILQRHLGERISISYLAIVAGDMLPDFAVKIWVYGFNIGGTHYGASDPANFHRGWPGSGFTHSMLFGVLMALVVWWLGRGKAWQVPWSTGIVIGQWAHVLTDINDTKGTMLLFPFTTHNFSLGTWAYGAQVGKHEDAAAYFCSLGFVMDAIFLTLLLLIARDVLTRRYFERVVRPSDPAWAAMRRRLPDDALLAIYRGLFIFAVVRMISWTTWAHTTDGHPWDLSWGGPGWLAKVAPSEQSWQMWVVGVIGVSALITALWFGFLRRHRIDPPEMVAGTPPT
ncbi:MAG: metal-dependent hydrolase [Sporichthyaceae bacterium]